MLLIKNDAQLNSACIFQSVNTHVIKIQRNILHQFYAVVFKFLPWLHQGYARRPGLGNSPFYPVIIYNVHCQLKTILALTIINMKQTLFYFHFDGIIKLAYKIDWGQFLFVHQPIMNECDSTTILQKHAYSIGDFMR